VCGLSEAVDGGVFLQELESRRLNVQMLRRRGSFDLSRLAGLVEVTRRSKATVLHAMLEGGLRYGPLAGRLAGVEVVVLGQRGFGVDRDAVSRSAERVSTRLADVVLSNSHVNALRLTMSGLTSPSRNVVIPNGLDLTELDNQAKARFSRDSLRLPESAVVVAMVAGLNQYKNQPMLFRAAKRASAYLRSPLHILVVGDGPRAAELKAVARETGMADCIHFLGHRTDVPAILGLCDIAVLASHTEGTPNAVMEAMGCRIPVVATDVGGVSEVVEDGSTGWLVPPDDDEAMAARIVGLAQSTEQCRRMGEAGRERIRQKFSMEAMVSSTVAVYESMIDRKSSWIG
ncbi:MAG: glycosyltransferase, partial [Candidatus Latescibacteria bacterium]|jgi:glycosyltransferase involved in cell wall biosynthesis|nr:glycosyltransferase [Candidatus Latescibacterota bacterium]